MNMISKGFIIAGFTVCVAGCRSGLYEIETSENAPATSHLQYRIVDKLDPEKYSTEFLPVEVKVEKKKGSDDSDGLCCLTLGIIPAFYDEFEIYTITVNTPIGSKSANATLHAKSWIGWICLIPYPASGDERDGNPTLPNEQLEAKLKDRVVESLIAKFSADEYAGFVKKLNDQRLAEENRVKEKCRDLNSQIAKGEFESVIKACEEEMASTKKDAPWKELKERAIKGMTDAIDTTTDEKRLVALFDMVADSETKNKIVLHLDAMNKIGALPCEVLYKVFKESKDAKVQVAAVHGISEPNKLLEIATEKTNTEVAAAAYSKLNSNDAVNKIVEKACSMMAFSVKELGNSPTDSFKDYFDIAQILNFVNDLPIKELRATVASNILTAWLSDETVKFCWLDKDNRKGMFANSYLNKGKIIKFCENITEDDAEKLFDRISDKNLCCDDDREIFILGLATRVPKIVIKKRAYDCKEKARETVGFAGYYCGMTIKDFYVLSLSHGMNWNEIEAWKSNFYFKGSQRHMVRFDKGCIKSIEFDRKLRYKLFEKEDGEFWAEYLRTYIPAQQKSLAKTIESSLDGSSFKYQEQWIDIFDEIGCVYKSIKYNTKVCFGEKSGRFALDHLED